MDTSGQHMPSRFTLLQRKHEEAVSRIADIATMAWKAQRDGVMLDPPDVLEALGFTEADPIGTVRPGGENPLAPTLF